MTSIQPPGLRAGRKEWVGLAVLALPLLLVSMDVSVLYFAVPFIGRDLDPSATEQLWILDIYGFVLAGLLLTMGSLGDRIGRRRLLLIGAVGFSAASLLAAYSTSATMLIAARALLGVAGATLMPSTLGLIRSMFADDAQRSKAIAVWSGVMTGGIALGPVLSGVLLEHFWWGSVFLINLPAMALLLLLGRPLLPEFRVTGEHRFDVASAALSLGAVLPAIYGIKGWAADGFDLRYLAAIVIGSAVAALFLVRQRRLGDAAMLDLSLLKARGFAGSVGANAIATFALVGSAVFLTQYLQSVLGLAPLAAALWSLAPSVAVGAAAPAAPVLASTFGRGRTVAGGFLVATAGFGVLTVITPHTSLAVVLVGAGVLSAGLVVVMTLVTDAALTLVRPERAGAASATMETGSEFGGALGIAILGSIGAAIYTAHMVGAIPAGLSPTSAEAAGQTLGAATAAAQQLPAAAGDELLAMARTAFTSGMSTAAWVGGAIMLLAAIASAFVLRTPSTSATGRTADRADASAHRARSPQAGT